MKRLVGLFIVGIVLLAISIIVGAQEGTAPESNVSVTVYNQGTALIQDRRTFTLQQGVNTVDFTDVASSIDATSVSFTSLTDPIGTYVLEQNYIYDLVGTSALLQRYIDQTIEVTVMALSGENQVFRGQLLSGSGDIILREESGQVVAISYGTVVNIRFPELPEGLITRPTLRWLLYSGLVGDQEVELTYLTYGLNWTADYILLLNTDNTALDLNGWVTLTNTSGTSYQNAQLKLIAGDVNRLPETVQYDYAVMEQAAAPTAAVGGVEQRQFSEYQLYEVERLVTINNNETKQVEFVTGTGIAATQYFVYEGSQPFWGYYSPIMDQYYGQTGVTDVQIYLEFSTGEESGLGRDLPAGRVRVYQEDIDGSALLIGENTIDHTPEGEDVNLYIGNAFDLVGEHNQKDFQLVSSTVLQETYEILLRNRKDDQTVEIRVPEHLFRWSNWQILNSTYPYTQLDASTIEFRVQVEPGQEVAISYTVQYSWPR